MVEFIDGFIGMDGLWMDQSNANEQVIGNWMNDWKRRTSPDGAVAKSSANGLISTGFTS